jgi:Tfp pilus assembly protein PilF
MERIMSESNEQFSGNLAIRYAGFLIILIMLGGCVNSGSKYAAPIVTRDTNGFSITESARVGIRVRSNFDEANRSIEEKDFQRGIELLEEVVMTSPQFSAAHINLGIAYQRIDEFELAEASLLRALEVSPRHPVVRNELGIVYRRTGRFDLARESYEAALDLQPNFHFARKNLAILCDLFLADPTCALEHYELYREADPENEKTEMWIADLENRSAQREED